MFELLLAAFGTSLVTGMRHATDPDHVVAVTTIVSRERSIWRAAGVGALWGLGHSVTILLVGGLLIGLRVTMTPRVGLSLELAVAGMLITLGILNLVGTRAPATAQDADAPHAHRARTLPPFAVGTVHGLAGSAAATLFVTGMIADAWWAMAVLMVFSVATVLGMTLVTFALALPAAYAAASMARLQRGLRLASGLASVAFGVYLAHQIGFVDGLFTSATPSWNAH